MIEKKIDKAVKQVVALEEVEKFKLQILQQLKEAKEKKLYWIKKEIALEASFAACEHILKLPEVKEKD